MKPSHLYEVLIAGLFVMLSVAGGLCPVSAQEDDYLEGDVPEWLEEFGYDDTHESGPVAEDAAEQREGVGSNVAPRTAASGAGQCDCWQCRP